jgi:hypothetical protein
MNIGDNHMKRNLNIRKSLLGIFAVVLFMAACKKDDGAYAFENQVNVYEGNAYAYLKSQPGTYDSLVKVIDRVEGLKDSLTAANAKLTLFAATNSSFVLALHNLNNVRASQNKTALNLSTVNLGSLEVMLCKYIIKGHYNTDSLRLTDGVNLNAIKTNYEMHGLEVNSNAYGFVKGGPKTILFSDTKGSQYIIEWQRTTTQAVNIYTNNAIVHVLSPSHEFGFSEFTSRLNQ